MNILHKYGCYRLNFILCHFGNTGFYQEMYTLIVPQSTFKDESVNLQ